MKISTLVLSPLVSTSFFVTAACMSNTEAPSSGPVLPSDDKSDSILTGSSSSQMIPWGGENSEQWKVEAILANAATRALQRHQGERAKVAIPTTVTNSSFFPFGDGQSNAAVSMSSWHQKEPPIVGVKTANSIEITIHRNLTVQNQVVKVLFPGGGFLQASGETTAQGDTRYTIQDSMALTSDEFFVQPQGWRDAFPLRFGMPITDVSALVQSLPVHKRELQQGESVNDPVGVGACSEEFSPADMLRQTSFPAEFINQEPFVTDSVHAGVPQSHGGFWTTAVGSAASWVALSPFKAIYIAMEGRRLDLERQHGVPTGAGWHHIGDAGESLLNNVECLPVLTGYHDSRPIHFPGDAQPAYGLNDVAVFRSLLPGEALTATMGDYHFYAIEAKREVTLQIWVHDCEPGRNSPNMTCASL